VKKIPQRLFGLLSRIFACGMSAILMAGCHVATHRPSEKAIVRFAGNLGVGSLIFRVDNPYNGSQSRITVYEVLQVAGMENDYVLTRPVVRTDGRDMSQQDYKDLMAGIGSGQIRQWDIAPPGHAVKQSISPIEDFRTYKAALAAKQSADRAARYYIPCNLEIKHIYSRSGIETQGELQWYKPWWSARLDGRRIAMLGQYIEEVTEPILENTGTCRDLGNWSARFEAPESKQRR